MLNTVKYLKGIMSFEKNFAETASAAPTENKDFSLEWKTIDNKFITENKDKIKAWIEEKAWKDGNKLSIWFLDIQNWDEAKWWTELTRIANILEVPNDETGYNLEKFLEKINGFATDTAAVTQETKKATADVKKEVTASIEKSQNPNDTLNVQVTKTETEKVDIKINDFVKNFDEKKYNSKKSHTDVKKLQEELNKMWADLIVDGLLGSRTKAELAKAKRGETLGVKSGTKVEAQIDSWNRELADIIKNFDEKKYNPKKSYPEVKELQKALWIKVDGFFGSGTKKALRDAATKMAISSSLPKDKQDIVDSQFEAVTWGTSEDAKDAATPLAEDKKTLDDANNQIEVTKKSLEELDYRLQVTREVNTMLWKYDFADKRWFSIENLIRYLTNTWKESEVRKIANSKEAIFNTKEWKEKINRAINSIRYSRDERLESNYEKQNSNILDNILKAAPWLFGIYLWDIPLPIVKKMMPGVDINTSISFKEWLDAWMPWEFSDYRKNNKENPKPLKEMLSLRGILSETDLTSEEQAKILSWNLDWVDKKTKDLLISYLKNILIPNFKILKEESFTIFSYFWKRQTTVREWIAELEKMLDSWNLAWYEKYVNDIYKVIQEEWDVDQKILDNQKNSDSYVWSISEANNFVQNKFNALLKWVDSKEAKWYFNDYNRVFALENRNDLLSMWVSAKDVESVKALLSILDKNPLVTADLDAWQKANPSAYDFIKSLGDSKKMKAYHLSQVPTSDNLKYVNVWKGNIQDSSHGRSLAKLSNAEALQAAESETPEKNGKISTLANAYKTFVNTWELVGVSYEEFRNAFANKTNLPISEMWKWSIINTWRNDLQGKITNFAELAKKRWDTEVFKLAPITKEYTFYDNNGKLVKMNVEYNLYLRPDCTNPLLVPGTIKVSRAGKEIPEGEIQTLYSVKGKLPVVIPWFLLFKWGWAGGGNNLGSNPITRTEWATSVESSTAVKGIVNWAWKDLGNALTSTAF